MLPSQLAKTWGPSPGLPCLHLALLNRPRLCQGPSLWRPPRFPSHRLAETCNAFSSELSLLGPRQAGMASSRWVLNSLIFYTFLLSVSITSRITMLLLSGHRSPRDGSRWLHVGLVLFRGHCQEVIRFYQYEFRFASELKHKYILPPHLPRLRLCSTNPFWILPRSSNS